LDSSFPEGAEDEYRALWDKAIDILNSNRVERLDTVEVVSIILEDTE
jgi:hypothetical protein